MSLQHFLTGPLARYLAATPATVVDGTAVASPSSGHGGIAAANSQSVVLAPYRLQDIADYRSALQSWFAAVRPGGHLILVVPHAFMYEKQNALPSRWNASQRRLYTPSSLLAELEEALEPNTYRVRLLADDDAEFDYTLAPNRYPTGRHDVLLVIEKRQAPAWTLSERTTPPKPAPSVAFEPARTRVEVVRPASHGRILIVKLDHLGDFIMGLPALEKARAAFPDAYITLVVGSWNVAMAQELGLFDSVVAFDGFPRNSSEEKDDIRGKVSEFESLVTGTYDIAIDLRSDPDTRILLQSVRARIKAGIGTKAQFEYLDIFLPIDASRRSEAAWIMDLTARDFAAAGYCKQNRFEIACDPCRGDPDRSATVWGPYRRLSCGRYIFEPFIVVDWSTPGLLRYDVALNNKRTIEGVLSEGELPNLEFTNTVDDAEVEFRLWGVNGEMMPRFQFYGGRLFKQGSSSVLHQSEYLTLLIDLVAMRVSRYGLLADWKAPA